jgi:N-methylhydantoinase B
VLPAKCDEVSVEPGDMLIYRTAGGGGWKDRLDRPVEAVERDVSFGLVSVSKALSAYGVVIGDAAATEAERARHG